MSRPSYTAHLLVDGYNIIGAWTSLKQARDQSGLEIARGDLIEVLANYSAYQGFETHLVFDAYAQTTPSAQEVITQHLAVYYTGFGQTADSYIERVCAQHRGKRASLNQRLIVATSDRAQQLTIMGYGAEWMSALQLESEVQTSFNQIKQRQKQRQKPVKRSLMHTLDQGARDKLTRLRFGLK
ncbi:NYN domain-containing protein [Pseudanabaena sp. FACHB-2040]|uniref:NYN domain-containing protein n=1 Tax=Pseudanabaena sp. FACHB-2040 TaxID=2692859 RepID=UPI001688746C|nr:NYN domain-containing protein [Pseudanabaena sp. FACHB-2040]MBD0267277.1 NYN domain-containing protein [Cyanobacteria bacterium Co-bin8]MBD2259583.1 NYN domain-containing protein [Pseudanabaena sp. FACHB-2040]